MVLALDDPYLDFNVREALPLVWTLGPVPSNGSQQGTRLKEGMFMCYHNRIIILHSTLPPPNPQDSSQ